MMPEHEEDDSISESHVSQADLNFFNDCSVDSSVSELGQHTLQPSVSSSLTDNCQDSVKYV